MLCFGYGLVARLSWLFLVALGRFPVVFALALSIGRCGAFLIDAFIDISMFVGSLHRAFIESVVDTRLGLCFLCSTLLSSRS